LSPTACCWLNLHATPSLLSVCVRRRAGYSRTGMVIPGRDPISPSVCSQPSQTGAGNSRLPPTCYESHTKILCVGSHTGRLISGVGRHPTPKISTQKSPRANAHAKAAGVGSSSWVTMDSLLLLLLLWRLLLRLLLVFAFGFCFYCCFYFCFFLYFYFCFYFCFFLLCVCVCVQS